MAKPKKKFEVRVINTNSVDVYSLTLENDFREISNVEGITSVLIQNSCQKLICYTNPLYDINEIADEIRTLLSAEVPSVFRTIKEE